MKLALIFASVATCLVAAPGQDVPLAELEARIAKQRDDVGPEVLKTIGELETREAMQALLRAYDVFGSIYMRQEALEQLGRFDDVEDAFQPALEKLMNVAVGAKERELRDAAIERLGRCPQHGAPFLGLVVESPADDGIRERAMELHVRIGGDRFDPWYRKIYERTPQKAWREAQEARAKKAREDAEREREERKKKKRRRRGDEPEAPAPPEEKIAVVWPTDGIRALAMSAIVEGLDDGELLTAANTDRASKVRRLAIAELAVRDRPEAVEIAEGILDNPNWRATDQAFAAEILVQERGADAAKDLIDFARRKTTPAVAWQRVADLLSGLGDEKVDDRLRKIVGKGKPAQKAFAIRATLHIDDESLVKKIRRDVRDRNVYAAIAAIDGLGQRRDRGSVVEMEKGLERRKDPLVRKALMRALSSIYDGENEWVDRLVNEFAVSPDVDLRNAALTEIARLGRSNTVDVFLANLSHEDWSTRLVCLRALEERRDAAHLAPIVAQMQDETGRMVIEFGDALFRLTGQNFGKRARAWADWVAAPDAEVAVLPVDEIDRLTAENERRRLQRVSAASFFGIRIESHRVLFIIDVSGSMREPTRGRYIGEPGRPRIDIAKEELVKAVTALDADALFNIAPFASDVESWLDEGVASATEYAREDALVYAQSLVADGGTNLYGSLVFAFEDLDVDTIFVLSDGEPSAGDLIDPQAIRDAVADLNETRGVVIHTIAIGGQLEILEWLAEDSGGMHVEYQ